MHQMNSRLIFASLLIGFVLLGCAGSGKSGSSASRVSTPLQKLIAEYSEAKKRIDPFDAPYFELEEGLDQFGDYPSRELEDRYDALTLATWKKLNTTIVREALSQDDQLVYDLFRGDLEVDVERLKIPETRYLGLNQMHSRVTELVNMSTPAMTVFPFDKAENFDNWLSRLSGVPAYVDREISRLKEGQSKGFQYNCVIVDKIRSSFSQALTEDLEKSPFMRPLQQLPKSMSQDKANQLKSRFAELTSQKVVPALKKFDAFIGTDLKKQCRKTYGLTGLPKAREMYRLSIWGSTGLNNLTAEQIHQTGLSEVARIKSEILAIAKKRGHKGTLAQFLNQHRNDPNNYFKSSEEVVQTFEKLKEKIDPLLPKLFSEIPKTPYKVVESENPEDAAASYWDPSLNKPYGRFVVNTKNLKSNQRSGVTTLSLHEANPGHHFHLALVYEKKDQLSDYQRKLFHSTAFSEGWALYAERLGREMGLFQDDDQMLGHLNDEMMRAVRLVVDTGIHAKGWSRARTIRYMMDHMASDPKGIEIEADRYSVWPGQALGYKIGQLKILELRSKAERELGARFDIREFHRQVLGTGTLSLPVLEQKILKWIAKQKLAV